MKRPLLPVLFCFISGILVEHYWSLVKRIDEYFFQSGDHFVLAVFYGVLVCVWYGFYRFGYSRLSTFFLLFIAVTVGMTRYAITLHNPIHHISNFVKDERATIEGIVYKPTESVVGFFQNTFSKRRYLYVETTWLEQKGRRYRVCGKVRITLGDVSVPHSKPKTFSYGDIIRTRLQLAVPKNYDDNGSFNYQEFLRRQGIYLVGYLKQDRYIIKLPEQRGNLLLAWIYALRNQIICFFDTSSSTSGQSLIGQISEEIQVIKAMTLGTSRELSPSVKEKFRRSGMYHFLVVSGIHIGILVLVAHQFLHVFHIPLRYRSIFLTIALLTYTGLTGFHFPVLRATIMALTLYLSITCNRIPDPLYSLVFSVAIILLLFPCALFEVSFQLTVAATTSILILYRFLMKFPWWERFSQVPYLIRLPAITGAMTAGAMIGISPLMLYYFQRLYPFSLVSNVIALPVVSLLLPLSLLSGVLSLLLPWSIVSPLLSLDVFLTKGLLFLARLFPETGILPRPPLFVVVIYYIVIFGGLSCYRGGGRKKEKTVELI